MLKYLVIQNTKRGNTRKSNLNHHKDNVPKVKLPQNLKLISYVSNKTNKIIYFFAFSKYYTVYNFCNQKI